MGQVWKLNDDIQKMPMSNKIAYRRCIMERSARIKDTMREFQCLVESSSQAREAGEGEGGGGQDEFCDEDDFEDESYTPAEVRGDRVVGGSGDVVGGGGAGVC